MNANKQFLIDLVESQITKQLGTITEWEDRVAETTGSDQQGWAERGLAKAQVRLENLKISLVSINEKW